MFTVIRNILLGVLSLISAAVQVEAGEIWEPMPLRTAEQKVVSMSGGEGFQQIQTLVYAPSDPQVVYMATDTSQVWKSLDGGASWSLAGDNFPVHGAASLFVDPSDKNLVLAAGFLGEPYERGNRYENKVQGICRSTDGGTTWTIVLKTDFFRQIVKGQLFESITDQGKLIIYCGTWDNGLLASRDKGLTWYKTAFREKKIRDISPLPGEQQGLLIASESGLFQYGLDDKYSKIGDGLPSAPMSISMSATPQKIIYAACGDNSIYLSHDMGNTFQKKTPSLINSCVFAQIESNPQDGRNAFAFTNKSTFCTGIWSTHNSGESWSRITRTVEDSLLPKKQLGQWIPGPIAFHPGVSSIALAGVNGHDTILRTVDGGQSWSYSASGFRGGRMMDISFPEKHNIIVALTDFGLWKSENTGDTFKNLDTGKIFGLMSSSSIASEGNIILASLGSWGKKGIIVSVDHGHTWRHFDELQVDNLAVFAINNNDNNTFYAGPYLSVDKGRTWKKLGITILATYPKNNDIIYGIKEDKYGLVVIRSIDKGNVWAPISKPLLLPQKAINDFEVHPNDPDIVFLATSSGVAVLGEKGWSMKNESNGIASDIYGLCHVKNIAISRQNPNVIYIGRRAPGWGPSNGLFRSTDGGETWVSVNGNLPKNLDVFGLAVSPHNGSVYIGTSLGTFVLHPEPPLIKKVEKKKGS